MNTTITLVRHGETGWNALGKFQGCSDIELSNEGIYQAENLSKKFNNKFDFIYSSPLKRANKTAEIISEGSNKDIGIAEDLREINFGEWEGLTIKEIESNFPKKVIEWRTDEINGPLCGGDLSLKKASLRAHKAILEIAQRHIGHSIIIVAHSGIIKAGLIGIFDLKMTMYHKIMLGNTSVSKIIFDEDFNAKIETLNDTSHLLEGDVIK
ncbi:MAG: histidine phosphatase family protein [Clostridium sp.]|uniref:histidine phosphatase family protein n=1 Tax=Clostridium sp. TaxID=1506 RepID=UPI003D6CCB95